MFTPDPPSGRVFAVTRIVRSTDVTPRGCRLDAIARYLQDAAEDDLADTGLDEPYGWVLRRVTLAIRGYPAQAEPVSLRTYCSATGPRWAERTTTLASSGEDLIQAKAVWAAIGRADGGPAQLGAAFRRVYGPSAQGREVSVRLRLPAPPGARAPAGRPWPLRAIDLDPAGHVNNTVHWAAAEDVLAGLDWRPACAELDYNRPILPGYRPELVTSAAAGELRAWLLHAARRLASMRLIRPPGPAGNNDPSQPVQARH